MNTYNPGVRTLEITRMHISFYKELNIAHLLAHLLLQKLFYLSFLAIWSASSLLNYER